MQTLQFDKWKGWIYLIPVLVLIAVFTVWPIFNTVKMAFMNGYSPSKQQGGTYVVSYGIENFKTAVKTMTGFPLALKNTLLLTFVTVPLSTMFGYATDLRSKTQGRATYSMEPSHFVELPKNLQESLVNARSGFGK